MPARPPAYPELSSPLSPFPRGAAMSNDPIDQQRRNINEFMQILPLTLAIAGLPDAAATQHFTEGQMEARAATLRNAYKQARAVIKEIASR